MKSRIYLTKNFIFTGFPVGNPCQKIGFPTLILGVSKSRKASNFAPWVLMILVTESGASSEKLDPKGKYIDFKQFFCASDFWSSHRLQTESEEFCSTLQIKVSLDNACSNFPYQCCDTHKLHAAVSFNIYTEYKVRNNQKSLQCY